MELALAMMPSRACSVARRFVKRASMSTADAVTSWVWICSLSIFSVPPPLALWTADTVAAHLATGIR